MLFISIKFSIHLSIEQKFTNAMCKYRFNKIRYMPEDNILVLAGCNV